jgi:hypothetical protein
VSDSLGTGQGTRPRRARGPFPRWLGGAGAQSLQAELAATRQRLAQATAALEHERAQRRELQERADRLTALLEDEHRSRREAEEASAAGAPVPIVSGRELRRRQRELRRALKPRRGPLRRLRMLRRRRRIASR